MILLVVITTTPLHPITTIYVMGQSKTTSNNIINGTNNSSLTQSIQQQQSNAGRNNIPNQNNDVLVRGIISSEPGLAGQLKVQRTII